VNHSHKKTLAESRIRRQGQTGSWWLQTSFVFFSNSLSPEFTESRSGWKLPLTASDISA
jgi:hypothetical protein